ncbi:MAG: hypothetical protein E4G74_03735, partial [Erysipelotrichales bacterium]
MMTMKQQKPRKTRQVLKFSVLVFLALAIAGGFFAYKYVMDALRPVSASSEVVTMEIAKGSTT